VLNEGGKKRGGKVTTWTKCSGDGQYHSKEEKRTDSRRYSEVLIRAYEKAGSNYPRKKSNNGQNVKAVYN